MKHTVKREALSRTGTCCLCTPLFLPTLSMIMGNKEVDCRSVNIPFLKDETEKSRTIKCLAMFQKETHTLSGLLGQLAQKTTNLIIAFLWVMYKGLRRKVFVMLPA